jgi:hypothetical protein
VVRYGNCDLAIAWSILRRVGWTVHLYSALKSIRPAQACHPQPPSEYATQELTVSQGSKASWLFLAVS